MTKRALQTQFDSLLAAERQDAYDKGYAAGFAAAVTKMSAALSGLGGTAPRRRGRPRLNPLPGALAAGGRAGRGQVREAVAGIVAGLDANGLGGSAIRQRASEAAGQEFSINSVRAALASLHKAGAIGKTGSKWHPVPVTKKRAGKTGAKKTR